MGPLQTRQKATIRVTFKMMRSSRKHVRCVMDVRFGVYKAGKGAKKFGSREVLYVMRHPLALVVSDASLYDVPCMVVSGICRCWGYVKLSGGYVAMGYNTDWQTG